MNRSTRQKINEETEVLNDTIDQMGLIYTYETRKKKENSPEWVIYFVTF